MLLSTSSISSYLPAPAVSTSLSTTDPSTQQWTKVLDKEEPERERSRRQEESLKYVRAQSEATARRLGLENSPSRWQSGHDGWFFGTRYIEGQSLRTQRMRLVEIRNWPIKVSTLRSEGQIMAYRNLLKSARLDQVASYYRLHCEQLDKVRCYIAYDLTIHRENDKHSRQVFPVLFSRHDHVARSSKLKKAAHAVQVADKRYRLRAGNRAYARGLEMLIEECEVRLQKNTSFTPADWRAYSERPRWSDGRRDWTGLRPEEVDVDTVDIAKAEEIGLRNPRGDRLQAVLRARYARSFPRAADKRFAICNLQVRGDGEIVRADGREQAQATL